jgi:hypothetical protein
MNPNNQPTGPMGGGVANQVAQTPGAPTAPLATPPNTLNSTQNSLMIAELREGMAIMHDGSFRAVVKCQSINFDLMSDRERDGVVMSYQNFLNSLNFDIQILIRSQRVDIGPYINRLVDSRRNQDNMLLGVLMDDYINFIDNVAENANIMDKSFYIVVPHYTVGSVNNAIKNSTNLFKSIFSPKKTGPVHIDSASYVKAKEEVGNRVNLVLSGLFQIGIQSHQLNTKQLGELYYNFYNPDTAVNEELSDFNQVASIYTKKADGPAPDPYAPQGGNR